MTWALFPHCIVRTTGFPFELVERLRCARAAAAGRRALEMERQLLRMKDDAPRIRHPPRSVLAALKALRPVPVEHCEHPEQFADWNRIAGELEAARAAFEAEAAREVGESHAALRSLAEDARFREAIASSSPPVLHDLERGTWSGRLERQAASYVQRLAAKNETMSFFGPINYGRLRPEAPGAGVELSWSGPHRLAGRRTHLAAWLVQGIAARIAADPGVATWLVPRRKGFAEPPLPRPHRKLGEILVETGRVTAPQVSRILERQAQEPARPIGELLVAADLCTPADVDAALRLQASSRQTAQAAADPEVDLAALCDLVRAADGRRTLGGLAEALKLDLEKAMAVFRAAFDKRLLTHQLEIPSSSPSPVADLVERLAGIPGPDARRHLAWLREVEALMDQFSAADARGKVQLGDRMRRVAAERWTVQPQEHQAEGQGHFYADRLPMREECGGDLRLALSGERARELEERLRGPLDLLAAAAARTRKAARDRLGQLLGKRTVPLWKAVAALSDRPIPEDAALQEQLARMISDPAAREVQVQPTPDLAEAPRFGLPVICSIDLLVAAKDVEAWSRGDYRLVMGDVHDTALVWGWALQFHPERAEVERAMVEAIGQAGRAIPVVTALASRRTGLLPAELPGPVVELGGVSGRPSAWRLPFDDLRVESDGTTCRLVSESLRAEVALYNGELESLVHTAFALPRIRAPRVDLGVHTPRISLGGVVLQRERWRPDPGLLEPLAAARSAPERIRAAVRLWDRLGLPEHCFAKFARERKPVLVSPDSPALLHAFSNLLAQKGEVALSEMLPSASDLWLRGPEGRHTSELRFTFIREAASS